MTKILLIEDDTYIRDIYEEVLQEAEYEVTSAADGEEGFSYAKEGGYDLIILDVMMPKLDGLGVLKELKENPPSEPNGPVILLTNVSYDSVVDEAKQLGASVCIAKVDITPDKLLEEVKALLS